MHTTRRTILLSAGLILLAAICGAAYIGIRSYISSRNSPEVTVGEGRISNVETMARLCTMEIYSEVPVVDTINNKVLVGIQKQRGRIYFDLEGLNPDLSADTIRLALPKEIVEIYESTDPGAWEVVDSKNIGFLGQLRSDRLTPEEENLLKAHIKRKSVERLYRDGTVARARKEGAGNIERFLSALYGKPVKVSE